MTETNQKRDRTPLAVGLSAVGLAIALLLLHSQTINRTDALRLEMQSTTNALRLEMQSTTNALRLEMQSGFDAVNDRFDRIDDRLLAIERRIGSGDGQVSQVQTEESD